MRRGREKRSGFLSVLMPRLTVLYLRRPPEGAQYVSRGQYRCIRTNTRLAAPPTSQTRSPTKSSPCVRRATEGARARVAVFSRRMIA